MYRNQVIESIKVLDHTRTSLLEQIINLAMMGEMKDIDDSFEQGEVFSFDIEMFRDMKDQNIQSLVALYDQIEKQIFSLMNLNAIDETEL